MIAEFTDLGRDLGYFFSKNPDPVDMVYVQKRLSDILLFDEVRSTVEKFFGENAKNLTPTLLVDKVTLGQLDLDTLYKIAKKNREIVEKEREELKGFAEQTKKEFKEGVERAVSEGKLPAGALVNLNRIDAVTFQYADFMKRVASLTLGSAGSHGKITLNSMSLRDLPKLRHIIFHELVHEISGKSFTLESETFTDGHVRTHLDTRKVGLRIGYKSNAWINEAVTETIALMLSGWKSHDQYDYGSSFAYQGERIRFDLLLLNSQKVGGRLWDLAAKAFFENLTNDLPPQDRARNFANLVSEVNRLEGEFAWNKIENSFILVNEIVPALDIPLTLNESQALKYAEKYTVYKVDFTYGKNSKARITRPYYMVSVSQAEFEKDLEKLNKMAARRTGFHYGIPVPVEAEK